MSEYDDITEIIEEHDDDMEEVMTQSETDETIFNTPDGQTIKREMLITYLNTGTKTTPEWSALGSRVEDSTQEFDWSEESKRDILGIVHSSAQEPVTKQSFDPCNLDAADSAIKTVWEIGVRDKDAQALCNMDLLVVHFYAGNETTPFAERYPQSMVLPTGLGGSGTIEMPIDITFGGARQVGTASRGADGSVTFTPES